MRYRRLAVKTHVTKKSMYAPAYGCSDGGCGDPARKVPRSPAFESKNVQVKREIGLWRRYQRPADTSLLAAFFFRALLLSKGVSVANPRIPKCKPTIEPRTQPPSTPTINISRDPKIQDAIYSEDDALHLLRWRRRLQKVFLGQDGVSLSAVSRDIIWGQLERPRLDVAFQDWNFIDSTFRAVESFPYMTTEYLTYSKIG